MHSLLSTSKITEKNCTIIVKNENAKIYNNKRELQAVANIIENLYCVISYIKDCNKSIYANTTSSTDKENGIEH